MNMGYLQSRHGITMIGKTPETRNMELQIGIDLGKEE